jgi:hypothetical protein
VYRLSDQMPIFDPSRHPCHARGPVPLKTSRPRRPLSTRSASGIVSALALALAVASCTITAPTKPIVRTVSVTASAPVPTVPTVPITVRTNGTESQVSVEYSLAELQALVTLYGGPVTLSVTDVAPKDYASRLPTAAAAWVNDPTTALALLFDAQRSGASLAQLSSGAVFLQSAPVSISKILTLSLVGLPSLCRTGITGVKYARTASAGTPTIAPSFISAKTGSLISITYILPPDGLDGRYVGVLSCSPITGGFGAAN